MRTLGYRGSPYRHPSRTAIFVGDLIDRGPDQLRVLQIVKAMVDAGTARMVPEISLTGHGQVAYRDKGGHLRGSARVRWWNDGATTLRGVAEMGGMLATEDGAPYPQLPDIEVSEAHRAHVYAEKVPVI